MRWFLIFLPVIAVAQPISVGVKIGAPVTDAFDVVSGRANFLGDTKRLLIGPTVELRLPFGFGVEVDALYRRFEYNFNSAGFGLPGEILTAQTKSGSWEFPLLAKYRTPFPLVKPYGVGGLTFNHLTGVKQTLTCLGGTCSRSFDDVAHDTNVGLVLGAGIQVNALLLKISPEIR